MQQSSDKTENLKQVKSSSNLENILFSAVPEIWHKKKNDFLKPKIFILIKHVDKRFFLF